jgi:hypothetical protein
MLQDSRCHVNTISLEVSKSGNIKRCSQCQEKICAIGVELPLIDRPMYQKFVCQYCLAKERTEIIKYHLKINNLNRATMQRARDGLECSEQCMRASARWCSVAQRASALRDAAKTGKTDD